MRRKDIGIIVAVFVLLLALIFMVAARIGRKDERHQRTEQPKWKVVATFPKTNSPATTTNTPK
jgi:hypothetical protein